MGLWGRLNNVFMEAKEEDDGEVARLCASLYGCLLNCVSLVRDGGCCVEREEEG